MGWNSCPCSFQSYTCCRVPTSWAAIGLFYESSLPRHGHIWRHLWWVDKGVDLSPPAPLPHYSLLGAARARKIFLVFPHSLFPQLFSPLLPPGPSSPFSPSPFPNCSPLSLPLPPYFHLLPFISNLSLILSATSSWTSLPSEKGYAGNRLHDLPIYNPTRYLYITTVSMQDREATFRILEKHFARYEIHTWIHYPHILITLWTITRGLKALLRAREYRQPPLLEYWPVKNSVEENMFTCFNQGSSNTVQGCTKEKSKKAKRLRCQGCHLWWRIDPNNPPPPPHL